MEYPPEKENSAALSSTKKRKKEIASYKRNIRC
jgi:hypothetical protein